MRPSPLVRSRSESRSRRVPFLGLSRAFLFLMLALLVVPLAASATSVTCPGAAPPPFFRYEVQPASGESVSYFRVETEDRNAADGSYANFIQPSGWPDPDVADGYVTWKCDATASNCPLPPGTHTFGFTNDHPARMGDWETNAPDSSSNHSGDCTGGQVWIPKKRDLGGSGGPGPGGPGDGRVYIDIVFEINDPGGMQLSSFYLTLDGNKIPGSDIGGQVIPQGTSTFPLCLPDKPNDAHLKYAWFKKSTKPDDPPGKPELEALKAILPPTVPTTCHDIDPFELGVWYPLICKRTESIHVMNEGDGAKYCFAPFDLQARGRAVCSDRRSPVEGRDFKVDGLPEDGYGFGVTESPDTDGDGTPDSIDNCFSMANADQADADADGVGDLCDPQAFEDLDGFCPCDGPLVAQTPWKSHGHYVDCVATEAFDLESLGVIDAATRDDLITAAGDRACGK